MQNGSSGIPPAQPWLLCIHNIPPKPPYLRAKVSRRLAALGAVALKNSVYILPDAEPQRENLIWLAREIVQGGGKAYVCRAMFDGIDGGEYSDADIRKLFVEAREADYRNLAAEFQAAIKSLSAPAETLSADSVKEWNQELKTRYENILRIDYFGTPGRGTIEGMLAAFEGWLAAGTRKIRPEEKILSPKDYRGRTWVTRSGVHVDRIASAWLIKRFIDPEAAFRFDARSKTGKDVLFDMVEGDFTHEGPMCTFEVLLKRFHLDSDAALAVLGEIIHDMDLDGDAPSRPESPGILALLNGICLETDMDEKRIEAGSRVLDTLYAHFQRSGRKPAC